MLEIDTRYTQPRLKTSEPTQGIPGVPSPPHYFTQQRGQAFQRHIVLVVLRLHSGAEIQRQGVDAAICTRKAPEVLQVVQRGGELEMSQLIGALTQALTQKKRGNQPTTVGMIDDSKHG